MTAILKFADHHFPIVLPPPRSQGILQRILSILFRSVFIARAADRLSATWSGREQTPDLLAVTARELCAQI